MHIVSELTAESFSDEGVFGGRGSVSSFGSVISAGILAERLSNAKGGERKIVVVLSGEACLSAARLTGLHHKPRHDAMLFSPR